MELFRNMEVALMLSFGLICAAAWLGNPPARTSSQSGAQSGAQAGAQAPPAGPMPVVVITGKRLSAAQKQAKAGERA